MTDATLPGALCPPPRNPQQRAAAVAAAFCAARSLRIQDVMRIARLSRRGAYALLDAISGPAGLPIYPAGDGEWRLLDGDAAPVARPTFAAHPNTRAAMIAAIAAAGELRVAEIAVGVGLTAPEARWLLREMRAICLPVEECQPDVWRIARG